MPKALTLSALQYRVTELHTEPITGQVGLGVFSI